MHKHISISDKPLAGLFNLLGKYRWIYLLSLISLGLAVAAGTLNYILIKYFTDNVLVHHVWNYPLYIFALVLLGFALIRGIFSLVSARGTAHTAESLTKRVRDVLFDHIQKLSFTYHDKTKTGELIQKATSDVDNIRQFFNEITVGIIRILLLFLINFSMILFLNWKLALVTVINVPVIIIISIIFFKKIRHSYQGYQEQDGKLSAAIQENLTGVRIVKAFARQEFERKKFEIENRKKQRLGMVFLMNHALYWPISEIICGLQILGGIGFAAYLLWFKTISLGTFIAYIGLSKSLIWPLQQLGRQIAQISTVFVSFGRIVSILKEEQEDLHDHRTKHDLKGDISFSHVSFAYNKEVPVLKDVSFSCQAGQVVALVGETGCGKSTLVNLLPRFYDKTSGQILVDGINIEHFSKHFLRRHIGIVEQEPFLFSTTIKNNITYGLEKTIASEEIVEIAQAAAIHDTIMSFPQQYETIIGEKGVTLSGGQKQRLAIARTLAKNPRLLILDDSTSALDTETEYSIQRALEELMKNRTTFIIAHKIQSLIRADLILVFKEGRIIQKGNHQQLKSQHGFYKEVFELQQRLGSELKQELDYV